MKLVPAEGGFVLEIQASPGSRADEFRGFHDERLRIAVTAAPERGKANQAICKFAAKQWGLKKSQVTLIAGETASKKKLLITGVDLETLTSRIVAALEA